jgi:hypothetical protein
MLALAGLLFFLAQPFWETKPPEKWTDHEIDTILHASPWSVPLGPEPEVMVYLATAAPIEEAESELRLRSKHPPLQPDPDYIDYLRLHREEAFVLAVQWRKRGGFGSEVERRRMENESEMVVGKKTYKIVGHFPPTSDDTVLRLVFPRELKPSDKAVLFRLFLPGMPFPEREVEFRIKDLIYRGKLEM